jgi:hypothetical protein
MLSQIRTIFCKMTCNKSHATKSAEYHLPFSHAMAQVVSSRPLTAEARVLTGVNPCGICSWQSGSGTRFFSEFFGFPLSLSFHRGSSYSYIICGMISRPVGGRSSETSCHAMNMYKTKTFLSDFPSKFRIRATCLSHLTILDGIIETLLIRVDIAQSIKILV